MHAACTVLDLTALNLRVVAFVDFDAGSEDAIDLESEDLRLGALSLQVDSHHLASFDRAVSYRKRVDDFLLIVIFLISFVLREAWLADSVDGARVEVLESAVRDHNVRLNQDARGVVVVFMTL